MIVWCEKCGDYTLDNPRHQCSWCEEKFTDKRLAEAKRTEQRLAKAKQKRLNG